jgi:MFS family permease
MFYISSRLKEIFIVYLYKYLELIKNAVNIGLKISTRKFLILVSLFVSTFSYIYIFHQIIIDSIISLYYEGSNLHLFNVIFYFSYGISHIIGSVLINRINRKKLLFIWIISGIIVNTLFIILKNQYNLFLFLSLMGFTLGFGVPSCFSFLADSTVVEERGRTSSITQFLFLIIYFILVIIIMSYNLDLIQILYLSIFIRSVTIIPLHFDSFEKEIQVNQSFKSILRKKQTLLFLLTWIMFSINNGIMLFFEQNLPDSPEYDFFYSISIFILYFGAALFGLISGFFADRSGRKQPLILGFIALGISYAFAGVATTPNNLLIMQILQGVGWGFILVSLQWVVLGDLAPDGSEEKYYALGLAAFPIIEAFFRFLAGTITVEVAPNIIASLLSVIMFVSVIPLLIVKETLDTINSYL